MAGAMTDYLEKKLLDHSLGKLAYTMPSGTFLALFTSDPTDTGSLTGEISTTSTGYARQALTAAMSAAGATNGQSANTAAITFAQATADWGTIAYFGIMDAATGGNMLYTAAANPARQILSGDQYVVSIGALTVTLD